MAKTGLLKKVTLHENWMAQADLPKKVSTFKTMNGRSVILSSKKNDTNKMTAIGVLKKIYRIPSNLVRVYLFSKIELIYFL